MAFLWISGQAALSYMMSYRVGVKMPMLHIRVPGLDNLAPAAVQTSGRQQLMVQVIGFLLLPWET